MTIIARHKAAERLDIQSSTSSAQTILECGEDSFEQACRRQRSNNVARLSGCRARIETRTILSMQESFAAARIKHSMI
jgi:hypothetical protein